MLEVRNLFKALNGNEILKNINLRFETGVYGLLGANGAGKTTLIKCLCNLYEIDSGSILYNGIQINHLKNNLLIYNRVVDKMKVVYPFYESVIIKKPKKVNV